MLDEGYLDYSLHSDSAYRPYWERVIELNPDQAIIFEKFGQLGRVELHSSGKTKFKGGGPGLGLPIARGILEAHGGSIWVESEGYDEYKCPGSTFHILVPARVDTPDVEMKKLFDTLERKHQ